MARWLVGVVAIGEHHLHIDEVAIEEDDGDDVDDDEDDDMVAHLGPDACVSRRRGVAPS